MKHVHLKTISSRSHKIKNIIPSKEAEDSSLMDQNTLSIIPNKEVEDSSLMNIISMEEAEDSSLMDLSTFKQSPVRK